MKNIELGTEKKVAHTITFKNKEHEKFYKEYLSQCKHQDAYHKALIYCLGIDRVTREHVERVYDLKTGNVKPECLREEWQTSGSMRVIRLAFNLYCNGTPSVYNYDSSDMKGQLNEMQRYSVEEIFCCSYAKYFWEALKIRYPEYCFYVDWEDMFTED